MRPAPSKSVGFDGHPTAESQARPDPHRRPRVVVVGAASRDIAPDDPRGWRLGGGAPYGALTLARLGVPTACLLGVDPAAAGAEELALLRAAGLALLPVLLDQGPVFVNEQTPAGRRQRWVSGSDPLAVSGLPTDWQAAEAFLFAPVADELGSDWAEVPPVGATVAFGWQGLLRTLERGGSVRRRPPRAHPLLTRADLVGLSAEDLEPDVALDDLAVLLRPGATLVLTRGTRGGLAFGVGLGGRPVGLVRYPATPATTVDPTGAGDVFLAAVLAARVRPRLVAGLGVRGDLRLAAAAGALAVEARGIESVPRLAAVVERLARERARRAGQLGPGSLET